MSTGEIHSRIKFCRFTIQNEKQSGKQPIAAGNQCIENPPVQQALPSCTTAMNQCTLVHLQENDPSLLEQAVNESEAIPRALCYYKKNGVLMRKWSPVYMPPATHIK